MVACWRGEKLDGQTKEDKVIKKKAAQSATAKISYYLRSDGGPDSGGCEISKALPPLQLGVEAAA